MNDDPLYSIPEAARLLGGISVSTVERMLSRGDLCRVKVGMRRTFIRRSQLTRVIREVQPTKQGREPVSA
jgi:excisionase family DNA binding protein